MRRSHLEALLWILASGFAIVALRSSRPVAPAPAAHAGEPRAAPAEPLRFGAAHLEEAAAAIARTDPLRLDRRPSSVAFSVMPEGVNGTEGLQRPPAPPKPQLGVSGIVGPPWTALLEGVPGHEGPVPVRTDDRLDQLRVRQVSPTEVVVVGMDTTWRLTIKRTWQ